MDKIKIIPLARSVYKKCECCERVKDVFFKLNIYDAKTGSMLVGDIDFCKQCGENFSDIMNIELPSTDITVTEFKFN